MTQGIRRPGKIEMMIVFVCICMCGVCGCVCFQRPEKDLLHSLPYAFVTGSLTESRE